MDPRLFAQEGNEMRLDDSYAHDHPWIEGISWLPGHANMVDSIHRASYGIILQLDMFFARIVRNKFYTLLDSLQMATVVIVVYRLLTESSTILPTPPNVVTWI